MTGLLLTQFPVDWSRGSIQPRCSVSPWVKDNWRATLAQCRGPPAPTDITFPTRVPFLLIAGISILQEHADGMSQLKGGGGMEKDPGHRACAVATRSQPPPSTSPAQRPTLRSPCIVSWGKLSLSSPFALAPKCPVSSSPHGPGDPTGWQEVGLGGQLS